MRNKKYVYFFGDGKAQGTGAMKALLGGKGAGLAEMTNLKISVPPGFTLTTDACLEYFKTKKRYPSGMWEQTLKGMKQVERLMKSGFGDPRNPLLVSVRSGARASMPGMMDTVLNLGLNSQDRPGIGREDEQSPLCHGFVSPVHHDVLFRGDERATRKIRRSPGT